MSVFHTGAFPPRACGKLRHGKFQIGEKYIAARDRFVKCKEKTSTFFFMKGRMSTFLPRTYQKLTGGITACIAFSIFIVENPVEKVENPMENSPLSSQKRWKTRWKK